MWRYESKADRIKFRGEWSVSMCSYFVIVRVILFVVVLTVVTNN